VPPLDAKTWASEFEKYQAIPEYQFQNKGMTLDEFKTIYWWEWGHRQLGRVIGLVWALGFTGLLLARKIPAGWMPRLLLPGILGGIQGAIGWWMVASGLSGDRLDVASYRLAIHLGLAFVILGFLAWYVLLLGRNETALLQAQRGQESQLFGLSTGMMHLAFLQILLGALVAGIDAGRGFPTWPLMNGQFFPAEAFYVPGRPVWAAFFENAGLVQFIHRMAGYALFIFGTAVWLRGRKSAHLRTRQACAWMMVMLAADAVGNYRGTDGSTNACGNRSPGGCCPSLGADPAHPPSEPIPACRVDTGGNCLTSASITRLRRFRYFWPGNPGLSDRPQHDAQA
jgi:cytochrome c oxidase assembly protein subunit 15